MAPNILLVVWDACRYDYAVEHASFFNELATSNIQLKNAIAPSPWSLPSHASLVTGKLPHEHGRYRFGDGIDAPLVSELSDQGYETYGVSANGFASQRTGFHEPFDSFRYTGGRDIFLDGMDVSGSAQALLNRSEGTVKNALLRILRDIPRHENPLKSLCNLAAVATGETANSIDRLQRIPHPLFAPTSDYSYRPDFNTRCIQSMLSDHSQADPFFLFTNYMDTHRCYNPEPELQEKHLGRSLSYNELLRLNETIAAPWEFERRKALDTLDESDVTAIRQLYACEVETADAHLRRLYDTLDAQGMAEDTLVIVTADHGENLGDTDRLGRRRMGHEASVSEAVLRVPLLIVHPALEEETIEAPVPLHRLYDLCLEVSRSQMVSADAIRSSLCGGPVASQYPATGGGTRTTEKYPCVPESTVRHRSSEHSAVVCEGEWDVIGESTGERYAFRGDDAVDPSDAPNEFRSLVDSHLETLSGDQARSLSDGQVSDLEALGYL